MMGQQIYMNKPKFIEDKCQVLLEWFKNELFEVCEEPRSSSYEKYVFENLFIFN